MLRAQNRVLRCAQPASRRLLRKTAILTQMLRPRNSATANECPGTCQWYTIPGTRYYFGGGVLSGAPQSTMMCRTLQARLKPVKPQPAVPAAIFGENQTALR